MYKTIVKIDGMMCGMCEAHINDVTGLKDAIDKTGYTVLSIDTNTYTKKVFGLF